MLDFDARQFNEAIIRPDEISVQTSTSLGGDNLFNILDALPAAGRISPAQYDEQHVSFTAATTDTFTKGVEVEFVANPKRACAPTNTDVTAMVVGSGALLGLCVLRRMRSMNASSIVLVRY